MDSNKKKTGEKPAAAAISEEMISEPDTAMKLTGIDGVEPK